MYILKRILFTIILFVAILITPWWVAFILSLAGFFYFNSYYEAIALGALFDILYGVSGNFFLGYGVFGFTLMTSVFFLMKRLKQELR